MIVVAIAGVILCWPAWVNRRVSIRLQAIRQIVEHGGSVSTHDDDEWLDRLNVNSWHQCSGMNTWLRRKFGDVVVDHIEIPPSLQDDAKRFERILSDAQTMTVIGTPGQ
jgi:hypothetical protein